MSRWRAIEPLPRKQLTQELKRKLTGRSAFATTNAPKYWQIIAAELFLRRDNLYPAHIGLQHVGHGDRAGVLLVGLHDRDQRAADRRSRTVQRVDEARFAVGTAVACVHAAGLEVAADRAARDKSRAARSAA